MVVTSPASLSSAGPPASHTKTTRQRAINPRETTRDTTLETMQLHDGSSRGKKHLLNSSNNAIAAPKSGNSTSLTTKDYNFYQDHRVLIYTTCYNVLDGVTLTIRKLEQELLAAGHSVCILTTGSGDPANTHLDGTHPNRKVVFLDSAVTIPFLWNPDKPELSYKMGFNLSRNDKAAIEEFEPSIVHITAPDCTCLHVIQYAREKEIPLMGTYHSNIPDYMDHYPGISWLKHCLGAYFAHIYGFLQTLYVPTPFIRKHLVDTFDLDRSTHMEIWGRGVDVEKFHPGKRSMEFRRSLGIDDDAVVVIWVGRLVPEKRPDLFGKVIRRLHALGLHFHALVVGAGPSEEEIKALPNTTFTDWMNTDQLSVAYASSDVLLFPSSVETFGNVTLEAAASGLPVIVDEGCSGHLVEYGRNGFSCPGGDVEAFFEATLKLVTDHKLRRSCGQRNREFSLSLEKRAVVQEMLKNYSKTTEEFYQLYGGRHENRDSIYLQLDAFIAGNYPRPIFIMGWEVFFVTTFTALWHMLGFFYTVRDNLGMFSSGQPAAASAIQKKTAKISRKNKSTTSLVSTVATKDTASVSSHSGNSMSNQLIQPSRIVELTNMEIHAGGPSSDDGTDSTETLSQSQQQQQSASLFACRHGTQKAFGDCELSHILCKKFVLFVYWICKTEAKIKTGLSSISLKSISKLTSPKRKKSCDEIDLETGWEKSNENAVNNFLADQEASIMPSMDQQGPRARRNAL